MGSGPSLAGAAASGVAAGAAVDPASADVPPGGTAYRSCVTTYFADFNSFCSLYSLSCKSCLENGCCSYPITPCQALTLIVTAEVVNPSKVL